MNTINKVKEFHETFEHPINPINGEISQDLRKLRIALIFEELEELAHAGDLKDYFTDLCEEACAKWNNMTDPTAPNKWAPDGQGVVDRVEELDALADLRYVLDGAVLALGFKDSFEEAFEEVHSSNMSKLVISWRKESEKSMYEEKGYVGLQFKKVGEEFLIMKAANGKLLKPSTYRPANIQKIVDKHVSNAQKSENEPPVML